MTGPSASPPRRPAPEPADGNVMRVVAIGAALWVVALVVAVAAHERLEDSGRGDWVWVCLAGVFLGAVGIRNVRRRRKELRGTAAGADPTAGAMGPNNL